MKLKPTSRIIAAQARHVNWIIKVSKLCNLRCAYCYEWNELNNSARIPLSGWESILTAIKQYDLRLQQQGDQFTSTIIWHGGEPLLLPMEYFMKVRQLQEQILGELSISSGRFQNAIQTNLYKVDRGKIDRLHEFGFRFGISMDVASGIRVTAGKQNTEETVAANMDWLIDRGIPFGAIAVLAGHTLDAIREIYDFYESLRVPLRVLPLYESPTNNLDAPFAISDANIIEGLKKLFNHWMGRKHPIRVTPLNEYLRGVILYRKGVRQPTIDRRINEWAIVVNTDGSLYQRFDAYDKALKMGNIFSEDINTIFNSEKYNHSLIRDEALYDRYCGKCEYSGYCNRIPLLESKRALSKGRCSIAHAMFQYIDNWISVKKANLPELERMLG